MKGYKNSKAIWVDASIRVLQTWKHLETGKRIDLFNGAISFVRTSTPIRMAPTAYRLDVLYGAISHHYDFNGVQNLIDQLSMVLHENTHH